jgi:hypothetical protein
MIIFNYNSKKELKENVGNQLDYLVARRLNEVTR